MIVILDIETTELIPDNRDLAVMRVSVAGIKTDGGSQFFWEEDLQGLFAVLDRADLIVGHNLLLFDYKVLQRYTSDDITAKYKTKTFDIFHTLLQQTDRRISLNDLAQRNLGMAKAGCGIDAPRLFKEGKLDELKEYLEQDLLITQRLFDHITKHGKLKYGHVVYRDAVEREIAVRIPFPATQ